MKISAARKMMKPKITSSSYIARRRLVKRRVKQAVFEAALKKKHIQDRDPSADHEVQQQRVEGGVVPCSFGVFQDGEFIQLTRGFLVNSGTLSYYLPVVDNHGFLLGQFSKLDDLSIVQDESPVADTSFTFSDLIWNVCNI